MAAKEKKGNGFSLVRSCIFFKKRYLFFLIFFLCKAQAQLDLSFGYSSYITRTDLERQLSHYMDVGLDFKYYGGFNPLFYGVELMSLFSVDKSNQNYLSVSDLFIAYELSDVLDGYSFNFVLGRQKRLNETGIQKGDEARFMQVPSESWSFMDEIWNLGLWEGRANWDYLKPRQTGLIGSFFTVTKNQWLFTLFLSGFFLPDLGPSVDVTNGVVSSGSRWFLPPQSEFILFSQRVEAFYWLQKPYLKNVVLNDSVAARFRFGNQDEQWFSLAYAYKPVNQIYFKVDGNFLIDKKAVSTSIHYQSFKHSLISMDFGMKKNVFKTVLSLTQEKPYRPEVSKGWIVPVLPGAIFFSSYIEINLKKYHLPVQLLNFKFLYSHFSGEEEVVSNGEGQLALDLNINRFRLYHGVAFSAYSRDFQWKDQSFSIGLSYWYSIPEKGGWLNTSVQWHIKPHLIIKSELDILGANDTKKQSFFNSYKQNDRITIKMIYAINN